MRPGSLLPRNLLYYWRTNLAVVAGVATSVAALAGALLVGESVRASLRELVELRLGRTDHVIAAGFFRERLAEDLRAHPQFAGGFRGACPLIALEGVVTHQENGRRASGVAIYGVDDRFWRFHGREPRGLQGRDALLSPSLAAELDSRESDSLLVRAGRPSPIPAESLHGRKDSGRTVRLSARGVLAADELGEFLLRPQQGPVRAIFVPLRRLQQDLDLRGKGNVVLVSGSPREPQRLEALLREGFALEDLGLRLRALTERRCLAVESDSGFIGDGTADIVRAVAAASGSRAAPVLTYLANTIRSGGRAIPYSLVTAVEEHPALGRAWPPARGAAPPIVLNDWAARDLGARPGDTVSLEYYVWQERGGIATATAEFHLAGVVPLAGPAADHELAPEYPGITDSDDLGDWDPPFPIDLSRIRPRDEEYWDRYRTTPKAFLPLEAGQKLWQSRFGKLTSIRVFPAAGEPLPAALDSFRGQLRSALDPMQHGFSVAAARAEGLEASRGATDFGEYFVYFSFFLVVSALLLAGLFFRLGVEQRLREIGLLSAVGYTPRAIRSLFWREGLVLAAAGSALGIAGSFAYGGLILFGLRTWWVDAVGTRHLGLHASAVPLAAGSAAGIATALVVIAWTLRGLRGASTRSLISGSPGTAAPAASKTRRALYLGAASGVAAALLLVGAAAGRVPQAAAFFGAGVLLLGAGLFGQWFWLRRDRQSSIGDRGHGVSRLGFRSAAFRPGRSLLSVALVASATFLIVAVEAFRRDDRLASLDRKSGTGGFSLLAEASLPIFHDPNTAAGRESLNLSGIAGLAGVEFVPFRLRPGDDASCLNLYRPKNPRILAPPADFIRSGRFSFQDALARTPEEKQNPWLLLEGPSAGGATPAIADSNSMTYILHRKLGEEIEVETGIGPPARLRLVAALADSILQGELVISEKNFLALFPDQQGYRYFLLDAPPEKARDLAGPLEQALSDYGLDVVSTEERLAAYHRVENAYLSTFQALGALGLLLGTAGLAAVLLRNVLERRREMALLRAVGYRRSHLAILVLAENGMLLFAGLATGAACALVAIVPALAARGGAVSGVSLGVLLAAVAATGLAACLAATAAALRSPLLAALRAE